VGMGAATTGDTKPHRKFVTKGYNTRRLCSRMGDGGEPYFS